MLTLLLGSLGGSALLCWGLALWISYRNGSGLVALEETQSPVPSPWPQVSVLIAACNEAATLPQALSSLLAEGYPDLEVIAVDDRSGDGTFAVLQRLAAADQRLIPLRVEHLPEGWLGKVHALEVARRQARGKWLLFSDADVHYRPGALRTAIALAERYQLGHLAVFPWILAPTFGLRVAIAAFAFLLGLRLRPPFLPQSQSAPVMGVGAFNLVRRSDLEKTRGLSWLKMDVIDDCALALLLRHQGAGSGLVLSMGTVFITWYDSLAALFRGLEKSALAVLGYRYWLLPLVLVLDLWLYLAPLLLVYVLPAMPCIWLGAAAFTFFLWFVCQPARRLHQSPWAAILLPFGLLLMQAVVWRGAWLTWRRGGVFWRGTFYSLEELRSGCRFQP